MRNQYTFDVDGYDIVLEATVRRERPLNPEQYIVEDVELVQVIVKMGDNEDELQWNGKRLWIGGQYIYLDEKAAKKMDSAFLSKVTDEQIIEQYHELSR